MRSRPTIFAKLIHLLRESRQRPHVPGSRIDEVQTLESDDQRNGDYDFSDPAMPESQYDSEFIQKICETSAFKRLSDIRFLGALDYRLISNPNGAPYNKRFTRLQHSIGVAAIAMHYLNLTDHTQRERSLCLAAAALHDIGHPPFSHTLEPIFKEYFGLDHHSISEAIIRGSDEQFHDILKILQDYDVNPEDVVSVLNGHDDIFDGFFSGPINFDTIEGILRSRRYLRMQNLGLTPFRVIEAATLRRDEKDRQIVDNFWRMKDEMYNLVIRSRLGVLYDSLFQEAFRTLIDQSNPNDFYLTDTEAFQKFPVLKKAASKADWVRVAQDTLPKEISFVVRRFTVNLEGDFFKREDKVRYQQVKIGGHLTLRDVLPS